MVRICSAESAIATCDSYNWPDKFKHKPKPKPRPKPANEILIRRFSFSELQSATSCFSSSNLLGKGSHGAVYRASLDSGALLAAVKRSTHPSSSFENEIEILSKIRGPYLVNLLGYGMDPTTHRLLLVVEYMPHGSLYDSLHKSLNPPGWTDRVRAALIVARAAASLHTSNPPVIHRDIKSSNILIDGRGRARLSDFGLALRGHVEAVRALSTPPAGTLGYLDPCYLAPGDVSAKSDVFSFGILLLEIISGRRALDMNNSPPSVEEWALPLIKQGRYDEICDRRIRSVCNRTVIREMSILATRCVRANVEKRPGMIEAVEWLKRVYKRVRSPVWNGLKSRVVKSRPLISSRSSGGREEVEEVVQFRHGKRRALCRSRKVSDVPSPDVARCEGKPEATRGSIPVGGRSKSFGSAGEFISVGVNVGKQKAGPYAGVKLGAVKLRKSRSVGVGKFTSLIDGKTGF